MCRERLRIAILCLMLPAACTSGGGEGMSNGDNQTPIDGQAPADTTLVVDSQPTDEGEIGQDTAPVCVPQPEMCDGIDNDCDTTIDNEPQASQSCDDADHCTVDVCKLGGCIHYPSGECDRWEWTTQSGASAGRYRHSAVWTGSTMIVWGGSAGAGVDMFRDGAAYEPVQDRWEPISSEGGPSYRMLHTAIWTGSKMVVWGGYDPPQHRYQDGFRYDPQVDRWTAMSTTDAPTPRIYHTAVWTGSRMIVWGGQEASLTYTHTGSIYDPADDTWTAMPTDGAPIARGKHTSVWTGTEMIVWGGLNDDAEPLGSGAAYDLVAGRWRPIAIDGAPPGAYEHTAVATDKGKMIVWGGSGAGDATLDSGGLYDPTLDSWVSIPTEGAPEGRYQHSAIWTGSEMVVWGGYTPGNANSGGVYNTQLDTWRPMTTNAAPPGRGYHTAVWTGSQMVIWGGWDQETFEFLNSGGRYTP